MPSGHITLHLIDADQAAADLDELQALYAEVYAEPPYEWGKDHAALFAERFHVQRQQAGFALVEARDGTDLAGFAFGVTLQPSTPWWQGLMTPLPAEVTTEHTGRTFALVELLVRARWRRQGVAQAMHDLLLSDRPEERATLTVLPAATPAQAAYQKWGWRKVAQKRNPLPGSPLFDVLLKPLAHLKSLGRSTTSRDWRRLLKPLAAQKFQGEFALMNEKSPRREAGGLPARGYAPRRWVAIFARRRPVLTRPLV